MQNIYIILNNSITRSKIKRMCLGLSIASSKPEKPGSTNDGHLSNGGEHGVTSQDAECAAVKLTFRENIIQNHK
uniref:Uncharacterized protein n=1 Tax=Cannabis sativa TaxID=3483 RepID=A0A803R9X4_CANSA